MEAAPRRRRRQRRNNSRVQQRTNNTQDSTAESNPPYNFYLSSMERQVRSTFSDGEVRLKESRTEGIVLLEIREESLANHLYRLQEHQEDIRERDSKLKSLDEKLQKAQADLDQQAYNNADLQVRLDELVAENTNLHDELTKMETWLQGEQQMRLAAENKAENMEEALQEEEEETKRLATALRNSEVLLDRERLHLHLEKTAILDEKASFMTQLEENMKQILEATMTKVKEQLETLRIQQQEERSALIQAVDEAQQTLQEKERQWGEVQSTMEAKIEELESYVAKKKRKKKWYRRLFCCCCS